MPGLSPVSQGTTEGGIFLNKAERKQTKPLHQLCQPARPCTGLWAGGGTGTKTQHELHPKLLTPPQDRSPRLAGMLPKASQRRYQP